MSDVLDAEISIGEAGGVALTPLTPPVTVAPPPEAKAKAVTTKLTISGDDLARDAKESEDRMAKIVEMVSDPDAQLADISRLIALEIAFVIALMSTKDPDFRQGRSFRDLNDQVKALRELQKTLTESDSLSRRDILNMDGPKFKFVLKRLLEFFKKAMSDAAVDYSLANNVMLNVGDSIKENDEAIRRELNRIEIGR